MLVPIFRVSNKGAFMASNMTTFVSACRVSEGKKTKNKEIGAAHGTPTYVKSSPTAGRARHVEMNLKIGTFKIFRLYLFFSPKIQQFTSYIPVFVLSEQRHFESHTSCNSLCPNVD